MIQSMTGFGKVTAELPSKKVTVEIKALNSKQLDLSTRIPSIYKEKEMEIRSYLLQALERGKVEFNVYIEYIGKETPTQINQVALENHYNQIKSISQNMGIPEPADWFSILLKMPDVIKSEAPEADEAEWQVVFDTIQKATNQLRDFRIQEGNMLEKLFEQKINNIAQLLKEVENYERERIDFIYYYPDPSLSIDDMRIVGPEGDILRGERVEKEPGCEDLFIAPVGVWPTDHKALLATFEIK